MPRGTPRDGLVGSTEWGEDLEKELSRKAVAYRTSTRVTGPDPRSTGSRRCAISRSRPRGPRDRSAEEHRRAMDRQATQEWNGQEPILLDRPDPPFEPHLAPLGSGSDYTVFVDHLGIASLNFGFEGKYGVYHSTFDSLFWMEKFGDPDFLYHAEAARLLGLLAMRLAGADVVPFRYAPYASALSRQLDELCRSRCRRRRRRRTSSGEGAAGAGLPADPGGSGRVSRRRGGSRRRARLPRAERGGHSRKPRASQRRRGRRRATVPRSGGHLRPSLVPACALRARRDDRLCIVAAPRIEAGGEGARRRDLGWRGTQGRRCARRRICRARRGDEAGSLALRGAPCARRPRAVKLPDV